METPVDILSRPKSLHISCAFEITSRSPMPHKEPIEPTVSYSGPPNLESTCIFSLLTSTTLLHLTGQAKHPSLFISIVSAMVCPDISFAFSKDPSLKFLVGSIPNLSNPSKPAAVPYKYSPFDKG